MKFDHGPTPYPVAVSQCLENEGRENVHFQQQAWGYFAFKGLLRCHDDRSLLLVETICDSIGFRAANRLRIDKVRAASCFSVLPLHRIMKKVTGFNQ